MKNKLLLHSIRKIKNNYKRFISLLFMSLLGVGFFAGIKSTSPNMLYSLDNFLDNQNTYDISIMSYTGLTDNDINKIKELDNIKDVYSSYETDLEIKLDDSNKIVRFLSIDNKYNKPYLMDGNMPENDNEIVVEKNFLKENKLKIGDIITLSSDEIKVKRVKIVGTVISPIYYSTDRGTTNIGDGKVNYYAYINKKAFDKDYYNYIYINVTGTKELITSKKEYVDKIDSTIKDIEKIKEEQEEQRFNELYSDTIEKLQNLNLDIDYDKFIKPEWNIYDRSDNAGYNDVVDASLNLEKLGNLFPLIFYIIAILISLVSMMRMVEEDRLENGTLKALGFNTFQITLKYIIYSLVATIVGGIVGILILSNIIPRIIFNIYSLIFSIPYYIIKLNSSSGLLGLTIGVLCICGSAVYVSIKELKNQPALLMRPKAPKGGKRVILEKIPFIWNRLNFSNKITVRNIFRYKSRVIATIFGICGCTALILSGFGLKDSIKDIVKYQYEDVFVYDKIVAFTKYTNNIEEKINIDEIQDSVLGSINTVKIKSYTDEINFNLIVPDDSNKLSKVIKLRDINNDYNNIKLKNNELIISEKSSKLLDVSVGDTVTINNNNKEKKIKIGAIVENYIENYAYINKETYINMFNEYENNVLFINDNGKIEKDFNKDLLSLEEVVNVIDTTDTAEIISKMMDSLNSVVAILIISSSILAFVVLYNLSNINISERKREIATLKVLGFYNKEVDKYITRENIILTIIGVIFGLISGLYLCYFIIVTCETDYIMFIRHIDLLSYIFSIVLTILFTIIINITTHFNLKKIDMISSLKNVE